MQREHTLHQRVVLVELLRHLTWLHEARETKLKNPCMHRVVP